MDSRSRMNDGPAEAPQSFSSDREERLLRFVDILRAEQVRASSRASVGASIGANAEGGGTAVRRWRGLALSLVVVVIAIGAATAFLQAPHPSAVRPDATHDPAAATASVQAPEPARSSQSAQPSEIGHAQAPEGVPDADAPTGGTAALNPTPPVAGTLSTSTAASSGSAPAQQGSADAPILTGPTAPPAAGAARSDTIEPLAPGREATALAAPPPAKAEPAVSESAVSESGAAEPETAKPVLLVYYPYGSRRGEATARSLATRIGSEVTSSDIKALTGLPDRAMIKFSDARNHQLARIIGKSLGDSGYRWRIEKIPGPAGSRRDMVEVWLPAK